MPKPRVRTRGNTTPLKISASQFDDAKRYGTPKQTTGGYQDTFGELVKMTSAGTNGIFTMMAYADNLAKLKRWAARADSGGYQGWCRDVLSVNGISYP